ncbi:MAG TPA: alpha-N-arabinofuranosidase [Sedimentisphaerales bacterium]|nr:alpha-N-arabinofuranosidase [Sedimentisphaerales bacterium]HQI26887.1 alpha-N-arabinofuranosidase [Sedimentisphaerales bacterium]
MATVTRTTILAATFLAGLVLFVPPTAADIKTAQLAIKADQPGATINRHIYGHFAEHLGSCIYGGIWVGEDSDIPNTRGIRNDVVQALKQIQVPNVRWPGGCFADEYHWKDGIGPREQRPTMVNTHWGGVTENNHFGTHEFFDLCEQLGCEPYICGNLGSGTVEEMADWIEYITFDGKSPMADLRRKNGRDKPWKLTYFAVGNENWGCGGNMKPEYYADQYRRYQTYVKNFSGNRIFKVACGPNGADYRWTEVLMKELADGRRPMMQGLAPHYYCGTGRASRSATQFTEIDWFWNLRGALRIEEILIGHEKIMDKYDPQKRVAIMFDEWGAWHAVEPGTNPGFLYQQNSLRDAMVAALTLNIFNNHCDRVKMANIAQMVNVLQAMILTDGAKMVLTPTYYVYFLYTVHHDATLLPTELVAPQYAFEGQEDKLPAMNVSVSRDKAGKIHVSLVNIDPHNAVEVTTQLSGAKAKKISGKILTAPEINSHNTFDKPTVVEPTAFTDAQATESGFSVKLPAKSIVVLEIEG